MEAKELVLFAAARLTQENTLACWGYFQGQEEVTGASEVASGGKVLVPQAGGPWLGSPAAL